MSPIAVQQSQRPLDALNFFPADVRDGLESYLAIYMLIKQKSNEASIGVVVSIVGSAGGALRTAAAGMIVVAAGYSAAFYVLAAIAGGALVLFYIWMPETLSSGSAVPEPLEAAVQP